jgi:hypothetical protein
MSTLDRRAFLGVSLGGLAALGNEGTALAALQCAPVGLPSRLAFDCSAGRNIRLFLNNASAFGLTGLVSMNNVKGALGSYAGGTMFLYPWLKSKNTGRTLAAQLRQYQAFLPGPIAANPLPNMGIPLDEQFCTYGLQAPAQDFIGFSIDVPRVNHTLKLPWYSVASGVAGYAVGIEWASANLNGRWFGGSRSIPTGNECNGQRWRALIVDAVRLASAKIC